MSTNKVIQKTHLFPYMGYKRRLKVKVRERSEVIGEELPWTWTELYEKHFQKGEFEKLEFKPILRPMEDIFKTIDFYGEKFCPAERLGFNKNSLRLESDQELIIYGTNHINPNMHPLSLEQYLQLFEWQFDVFRLGEDLVLYNKVEDITL